MVSSFDSSVKLGTLSEPRGWAGWPICEISDFRSRFGFDIYLKRAPSRWARWPFLTNLKSGVGSSFLIESI